MVADVEAAVTAGEQRLKVLAARLPGGDSRNYIVVLCDFIASDYGWGLDKIAGLNNTQMAALVEQALRRRAQTRTDAGSMIGTPAEAVGASEGGSGEQAAALQDPSPPGLAVDLVRKTITLNDKTYDAPSDNALRWVKVLADHPGEWISGADLENHDSELQNPRTDRWRKHLPEAVLSLIDSETGKGSRIRLQAQRGRKKAVAGP
jgi:hypothetical protein